MVKSSGEGFLEWARDGARTLEERYGIQMLVEDVYRRFCYEAGLPKADFSEEYRKQEERRFNPAYEPEIVEWKLEFVAGKLGEVKVLSLGMSHSGRALRDLSVLAFVPEVEELEMKGVEREDLEGVQHLTKLRKFRMHSHEVEDYGALAACRELREMRIFNLHPCPRLEGLEGLPLLEKLDWHEPITALGAIRSLPALRYLKTGASTYAPKDAGMMRDFHALPEMPLLEFFHGGWFYRLDGVERFPKLHFMTVMTHSKGLMALACLKKLTHLRVVAPRLETLADLLEMPGLLHFALYSARPQDWGTVLECASLREVFHWLDYQTEVDLGMTRLLLPNHDEIFAAVEARPLAPLRLVVGGKPDDVGMTRVEPDPDFPDGPDGWDGNPGMRQSEIGWAYRTLREALREGGFLKLQGVRFVMEDQLRLGPFFTPCSITSRRVVLMNILGTEAIGMLPRICDCLRVALSRMRFRWQIHMIINAEPDADEWDKTWRSKQDDAQFEARDKAEQEIRLKRESILREDELRFRMLKELGEDVSGFKPSPLPAYPDFNEFGNAEEADEDFEDEDEEQDDASGGIADYDPDKAKYDENWLPPVKITDPNHIWSGFHCMFTFDEDAIYMHVKNHGLDNICDLFDLEPEEEP